MSNRFQDRKHLEWIRTLPCLICKAGYYSHSKEVQAHHLMKPYDGFRGMGLKANDRNAVPLCMHHHSMLHMKFGDEFQFLWDYQILLVKNGQKNFGKINPGMTIKRTMDYPFKINRIYSCVLTQYGCTIIL